MKYHHTYSLMDVMMADPIKPMPDHKREHQINKMKDGLLALERAANPSIDDWEIVTDALNMMETLIEMGWAKDPDGLIEDAVKALAIAGHRAHPTRHRRALVAGCRAAERQDNTVAP